MKTKLNLCAKIATNFKFAILLPGFVFVLTTIISCEEKNSDEMDNIDPVTYSLNDLAGTWQRHSVVTTSENYGFWIHGTIDNQEGSSVAHLVLPFGTMDTTFTGMEANLSPNGVFTTPSDPAAHTYVSTDKSLMVGTTKRENSYTLVFDQKVVAGTTYSTADFGGTWQSHYLVAGGEWTGWGHGVSVIDNTGTGVSGNMVKSDGDTQVTTGGTLTISSGGVITIDGFASYHGYLSADKKLMITNMTDGGGGAGLAVAQKVVAGTTYGLADLEGTWQLHDIIVGSENWTEHGLMTIDASGNAIISNMIKDNGGTFSSPGTIGMQITTEGIITFGVDFHGFMSADKKLIIGTKGDDSGHAYSLLALQKMP